MSSLLHWDVARPSCLESAKDPELLRWGDVSRSVCVSEGDGGDLPEQSPLSDPLLLESAAKHGTVSGNSFALQSLLAFLL